MGAAPSMGCGKVRNAGLGGTQKWVPLGHPVRRGPQSSHVQLPSRVGGLLVLVARAPVP